MAFNAPSEQPTEKEVILQLVNTSRVALLRVLERAGVRVAEVEMPVKDLEEAEKICTFVCEYYHKSMRGETTLPQRFRFEVGDVVGELDDILHEQLPPALAKEEEEKKKLLEQQNRRSA